MGNSDDRYLGLLEPIEQQVWKVRQHLTARTSWSWRTGHWMLENVLDCGAHFADEVRAYTLTL